MSAVCVCPKQGEDTSGSDPSPEIDAQEDDFKIQIVPK